MAILIHKWMQGLAPNRKLLELCLPGSHDAGVYFDVRPPYIIMKDPKEPPFDRWGRRQVRPGSMARCQYANIWEQAMCGSRVFDIRVFLEKVNFNNTDGYREIPTMGHFFLETTHGHLGEFGGTLNSALDHAASFLAQQPSEFLIFRIGHTVCTKEVVEVLEQFRKGPKGTVIHAGAEVNLADLEYQQLKGKLLLVFDNLFMSLAHDGWAGGPKNPFSSRFSNVYGYYPYDKYPNIPLIGLSFCGEYSGDVTDQPSGRGNWSAESAEGLAHVGRKEHEKHRGNSNHLLWVYWQQTGGDIWWNTTKDPNGMHARLQKFLNVVSRDPKLAMPNVIGHDFVTKKTCAGIVKLNPDLKDTKVIGIDTFDVRPGDWPRNHPPVDFDHVESTV
jgi:hypothetical protein